MSTPLPADIDAQPCILRVGDYITFFRRSLDENEELFTDRLTGRIDEISNENPARANIYYVFVDPECKDPGTRLMVYDEDIFVDVDIDSMVFI